MEVQWRSICGIALVKFLGGILHFLDFKGHLKGFLRSDLFRSLPRTKIISKLGKISILKSGMLINTFAQQIEYFSFQKTTQKKLV